MKLNASDEDRTALILADDLTGACDAAASFAGKMHTLVALHADRVPLAEVVSVNLGSRDIPAAAAKIKLQSASNLVRDRKPQLFLKKIDSTFRGNTFQEIALCLELLPHRFAVLAPAFPGMGRTVRSGTLRIQDIAGNSALDLVASLCMHGVACSLIESPSAMGAEALALRLLAAMKSGVRLVLPDAETEPDLNLLARVGTHLGLEVLWFGSGGLAYALAQIQPIGKHGNTRTQPQTAGPVVFCIGSNHPVTQRQAQSLKHEGDVVEVHLGPSACLEMEPALRNRANVLLWMDAWQESAAKIAGWLQPLLQSIGALVFSGGDTAAMICDALAVETIELGGELLRGIPFGWLRGGQADGLTVVTKSGGFGAENALLRIGQLLQSETRTKA